MEGVELFKPRNQANCRFASKRLVTGPCKIDGQGFHPSCRTPTNCAAEAVVVATAPKAQPGKSHLAA